MIKVQISWEKETRVARCSDEVHEDGCAASGSCEVLLAELGGGLGKLKGGFRGPNNTSPVGEKGFLLWSIQVRAFHVLPKPNDGEIFPGLVSLVKAEKCL